jgi:hypothetical protein
VISSWPPIRRGKVKRTTFPGDVAERTQDLVDRVFIAMASNRLWWPT